MTINTEIKLHPESITYVERVLGQYTETDELKIINNPIVHIYAKEDTRDLETGELNGMIDALLCEFHIYDPENMTVYKTNGYSDSVMFHSGATPDSLKIFKDGSTLMAFQGRYSFLSTIAFIIRKVDV